MKFVFSAIILNIITYMLIWLFGKISGNSNTIQESFFSIFQWKNLSLVILANALFGTTVFLYFKETPYAIPITLAVGGVVSFIMSVIFSGADLKIFNILGIILTVIGVFLMFK